MSEAPARFPCQLSKLAYYPGKSSAFYALQGIHDKLVKAYGIDDTEQIRKLEDTLRTTDPSDSALDEYESCSNPSYATFLRETLQGTIKVATLNGFLKLVYAGPWSVMPPRWQPQLVAAVVDHPSVPISCFRCIGSVGRAPTKP